MIRPIDIYKLISDHNKSYERPTLDIFSFP